MLYGTLNRRHPCCDADLFERYDALYRGGAAFRKILPKFLPQNPLESTEVYALRQRDASYSSYVGPIVDFFSAQLFSAPFLIRAAEGGETRAPDAFYASFREDVDGNGADLTAFAKASFTSALVKGCSWWLAEMPDDGGTAATSRADWEARGLGRARLRRLDPDEVLDWECDDQGALLWAITYKRETRRDDPRKERGEVTETWKLYDAETVETFRVVYDPKQRKPIATDEISSIGRRPHGFTRVPLLQMRLPDGLWLLNRIADAQVEHFRLSAAFSWAVKRACYPMAVFRARDKNDPPVTGSGYMVVIQAGDSGHKDEEFLWVSPDAAPFEVLANEKKAQTTEIYRVAHQMAQSVDASATALGRSGDSKAADAAATEVCLHAYATIVKEAIENAYELVSDARGDVALKFSIEGMDKFSLAGISAALEHLKAAKDLGIPSETLSVELGCKAADMLLPDASQATKDKIRQEIQTAKPAEAKPPAPPAQAGGGAEPQPGDQNNGGPSPAAPAAKAARG